MNVFVIALVVAGWFSAATLLALTLGAVLADVSECAGDREDHRV